MQSVLNPRTIILKTPFVHPKIAVWILLILILNKKYIINNISFEKAQSLEILRCVLKYWQKIFAYLDSADYRIILFVVIVQTNTL